jgi:predicted enzyme related to lactoylglutathione lyase
MPERETAPTGAPCWVDVSTSDPARSREFYSRLFGWVAEEPSEEFGGYFMFTRDGVPVAGGMGGQPGQPVSDVWSVHLATEDAAKTLELATSSGAEVIVAPMVVGDAGTMAVVTDPGGAAIGAWQADQFAGLRVLGERSTPSWFELHTRDYAQTVAFYRDVFGWDAQPMSDTPEFRYTVLRHGEQMLAGILDASDFLPEGAAAQWSVYFGVDDADTALEQVVALGGSVVAPAEDTPYGRLAAATDPTGAQFKLVAPNEAMPANPSSS